MLDLHFVLAADFLALSIHSAHIGLIPLTQLVHTLDQIISLASQLLQLLVHQLSLLASFHFLVSQRIQFVIQLGKASTGLLMLGFEGSQVIRSPEQVRVDGVCLTLYLLAEVFLLSELCEQTFLLAFEAVELLSQFLV
jgi:hypothetical protein